MTKVTAIVITKPEASAALRQTVERHLGTCQSCSLSLTLFPKWDHNLRGKPTHIACAYKPNADPLLEGTWLLTGFRKESTTIIASAPA